MVDIAIGNGGWSCFFPHIFVCGVLVFSVVHSGLPSVPPRPLCHTHTTLWHLVALAVLLCGRRGTCGTGLAPVARLVASDPVVVFMADVAFGAINSFTHNSVTHNSFTHTRIPVIHTNLSHTTFFHTTLSHTTLSHPALSHNLSSTISLIFPAFDTCFVLLERSWHVGLSGPSFFSIALYWNFPKVGCTYFSDKPNCDWGAGHVQVLKLEMWSSVTGIGSSETTATVWSEYGYPRFVPFWPWPGFSAPFDG